jgi:hypothetical protein
MVSPIGDILVVPPISQFSRCFALTGKRQKRGENKGENLRDANTAKLEAKMKRKKTKRKQQGCDVLKVIDGVEQAVSTAKKVYRAVEPIVKTIVAHRRKTK